MPTGLYQSKDIRLGEEEEERLTTHSHHPRSAKLPSLEQLQQHHRRQRHRVNGSNVGRPQPFVRRNRDGSGGGAGGSHVRAGSAKPASSSSASSSASPPVTLLEVDASDDSDKESTKARRRSSDRADDDSDEDPHFRASISKKELIQSGGGESRSLRSKGSPPPMRSFLVNHPRVSEGKVMSRKRNKSSSAKPTKTSTSSSKPSSADTSVPDLVCIDSDDDSDDEAKSQNTKMESTTKNWLGKKKSAPLAKKLSPSEEICIDDDDDDNDVGRSSIPTPKRKRKFRVRDRTLVMPVHKYYYGWAEGEKSASNPHQMFRFRCSREACQHVTYDNVSAMRHAIFHVKDDDVGLDADIFSEHIRCPTCFLMFKSRYEMQLHFEKEHPVSATKSKGPHRCKICERELNGQEKFVQHMRLYHVRCDMPYVCPICSYRSSIYNMVIDHFLTAHSNVQEALCPYCLKCFSLKPSGEDDKFGDLTTYMSHLAEHAIIKRHKCQQCRLNFAKGNQLSTHAQCDHKTAKGEIQGIEASLIADHVPITVSEATSKNHDAEDGKGAGAAASDDEEDRAASTSRHPSSSRSQAILSSFVMTLGQRAGPQSLTAEGLKAWNLQCKECHRPFDFAGHFRTATAKKFVQCNKCKFITTCSFAYAKHMIFFHGTAADRGKIVPSERKVKRVASLRCHGCDFETEFGNKMAAHLMKAGHATRRCNAEKPHEEEEEKEDEEEENKVTEKEEKVEDEKWRSEKTKTSASPKPSSSSSVKYPTFEIIDSDSDSSDDDDVVVHSDCDNDDVAKDDDGGKDGDESDVESIVRKILEEILLDIDPAGGCVGNDAVEDRDDDDDDDDDDDKSIGGRSGNDDGKASYSVDVVADEVLGDNDVDMADDDDAGSDAARQVSVKTPDSPEIIALSDSDGEDSY